ncbi:MAG TPA: thioesterase family protein [Melioribacteraceae bacterium]|nr:thioesterase family protein [Melioribacteraceae bacterium]
MISNKTLLRVRYADTDKMQFVYNGKYLEYFEVGRTELLRSIGLPYKMIEESGYQLPLLEAKVKYLNAAVYDDLLEIEATNKVLFSAKVVIEYNIRRFETGELLCTGYTEHIFINKETKKATRPPQIYIEKLAPFFKE